MQKRVLLGAGAVILVVIGVVAVRGLHHETSQVADQTINQLIANLPPGTAVTHGAIDYNPLTGTATLHNVAVTRDNGVKWAADTVTLSIADSQALRDVVDPAAYPNGHPAWTDRRLLLNDASAQGVRATVPGTPTRQDGLQYTIGRVTLHRLSGRPFSRPPTPENRARPDFLPDAALALAVDSIRETDTSVDMPDDTKSKLTVGSAEASNYDAGKLGSLLVKNVALDGQPPRGGPIHATINSMSMKDGDLRPMLRRMAPDSSADPAGKATGTDNALYSSAELDGLAFISNQVAMKLTELRAKQTAPDSSGVRAGTAYLHGITVGTGSAPLAPSLAHALDAFGMRAITIDIDAKSHTTQGGPIEVSEDIALHDLGTLHVTAAVTGYTPPSSGGTPAAMQAVMATTLQRVNLEWDDASLVGRVFKLVAEQSHTTPEMLRGQLAMPLLALGAMLPDQPDAADQLSAFLEHPHVLRVTMTPQPPVSFAEVASAPVTARAHLLGVHITGN